MRRCLLLAFCFVELLSPRVRAADWPQYRGPNHDGISAELIRTNWTQEPPKVLWRVALQAGLSSLSVAGGKVFTQVKRALGGVDREFCVALDAETGRELWAVSLDIADYPNGGVGFDDGPRSTPTVDNGRVYVLTSYLRMFCLEASTGQEIWKRDLVAEFGAEIVAWQNAASPLVVNDLIFLIANVPNQRLMALRKTDGSVAWSGQNDRMTQATPIAATIAGIPQVVFFAQSGLVSVVPETGQVLWRYAFPFSVSTAASPVVAGDTVYCSASYGVGAGVASIRANGAGLAAQELWRKRGDLMNHWATPVYHDGYFYGVCGESVTTLRCADAQTGTEKWRQSGVGLGGLIMVAGHLLVFTEGGNLVLVKPNPARYDESARFAAITGSNIKCWNVPAVSNGRIYARSTLQAVAIDVAPKSVPKPKLKLAPDYAAGRPFQLVVANEDGTPLDASRAGVIDIFATFDFATNPAGWIKLNPPGVLTNGQIRIEDPQSSTTPMRFFRTEERP